MSARSTTIIRQTTYWGEEANTEELMRFYRHSDGYLDCHGLDIARAVMLADKKGIASDNWVQGLLQFFFCNEVRVEFEPYGYEHGDITFLYVVEGIVDLMCGRKMDDILPITISVYKHSFDEPYISTELNTKPIFSGTAYEYIEKFGKEK